MTRSSIRRMILYGLAPVMLGYAYYCLYYVPRLGAEYCFGYESGRWGIEVRGGRVTLHEWDKIVEGTHLGARRPSLTKFELDQWYRAMPAARATGFFTVADKTASDPRQGLWYQGKPKPIVHWSRCSEGGYSNSTEKKYFHTCYPLYFLFGVLLLIALEDLRRLRRRRRSLRLGLCLKCGYDLRSRSSNRCPECGEQSTLARPATV